MNEAIRMQLSAFADGELPDNEKELLLRRLSQDPAMRRQVAEYLAIGRAMRGEAPIPGIETLRDRIAGAIGTLAPLDEDASPEPPAAEGRPGRRLLKPAAGLATAAAVALVAIVGVQRVAEVPGSPGTVPAVAGDASFSTQPAPDKLLDQYRLMHEAEAADSSMRARFTSIEMRQGLAVEAGTETLPGDVEAAGDEDDEGPATTATPAPTE